MQAAIIIPVHNGARFLAACLRAALSQSVAATDLIVVENGSTDGSAELVAEFPLARLLRHPAALGFSGAVNLGLRAALALPRRPDVIALLNQDTVTDPGWLAALLAALAARPQLGVVGSLARFPDGRIQHAGAELTAPLWYGRNLDQAAQPGDGRPFVSFLAVGLRTALLSDVGMLDEGFGAGYFEDADFCLRAEAAGWELAVAPRATLVHHEGALSQLAYQHAARIERNRWRLLLKHRPVSELLGAVAGAERAMLLGRAAGGTAQVLRQAYLRALLDLPQLAGARGLAAEDQRAVAALLVELRDLGGERERSSRAFGLPAPEAPARDERGGVIGRGVARNPADTGSPVATPASAPSAPRPVAIVMLTWNGLDYTRACLESIRRHTPAGSYRLIVVDNASTDGTRAWLRSQPDLTLIENETNLGFTRGNNQGMAAAPPDHDLLLLNNDTLVAQDGWLARLCEVAYSAPDYGIVGCTLLHTSGQLQHAGTYMPDDLWGYQIGGGERYVGQYPGVREVEGITGACMYIRRDLYAAIGGLDEAFFSYYEDTDYCLRARQAGYRVVCTGDVQITHHENTSSKVNRSDWRAMFSAGRQVFARKWRDHYAERYTRAVLWHSLFAAPTGYATSSREIVLALDQLAVDVRTACIFGTDYTEPKTGDPRVDQLLSRPKDLALPQVVYSQGDAFVKNGGRVKIGFTMHETDRLPEDWVRQANAMDEVWTPTSWGADVFRASGVTRPIQVIPLGFNPDYFHPAIQGRKPRGRYVFLSVFDWIERKGPDLLLRAYLQTFRADEDVLLILKVTNTDPNFDIRRHVAGLVGSAPTPPVTLLLNQQIAPAQLGSLYRSADCFVLPTRGEGWGMPTLEAMACGLPVISTAWGAQTEFLHAGVGLPLRVRGLTPAVARSPYYTGTRWAEPDGDHLCELMRYVYENPGAAQALGSQAAAEARCRWTWAHTAEKIIGRLDAVAEIGQ